DGKVCRLGALQDLVHVGGGPSEHICHADSVGDQPARLDCLTEPEHRWEPPLAERVDQLRAVVECDRLGHDEYSTNPIPRQCPHIVVYAQGTGHFAELEMNAECRRRVLQLSPEDSEGRVGPMPKNANPCCS